ncbi:MAG: adenosylmethionine decarboxylase [Gemmatimonadetes bacterium]|nr:adenosylmethionine decarboxylase [Gemmatimonadota bacterium]NIW75109.1 adenosylmethionine decarboxylase [Gemmatimonadota bacterium]
MAKNVSLAKLGGASEKRADERSLSVVEPSAPSPTALSRTEKDYFVEREGLRYAGTHLLIELWQAQHLDDLEVVEKALRNAIAACDATLLHVHLHRFSPNGGISGVAVLAESHISIHTWPERGYAAIDIFMCGACNPYRAVPVLKTAFGSGLVQLCEQKRGLRL